MGPRDFDPRNLFAHRTSPEAYARSALGGPRRMLLPETVLPLIDGPALGFEPAIGSPLGYVPQIPSIPPVAQAPSIMDDAMWVGRNPLILPFQPGFDSSMDAQEFSGTCAAWVQAFQDSEQYYAHPFLIQQMVTKTVPVSEVPTSYYMVAREVQFFAMMVYATDPPPYSKIPRYKYQLRTPSMGALASGITPQNLDGTEDDPGKWLLPESEAGFQAAPLPTAVTFVFARFERYPERLYIDLRKMTGSMYGSTENIQAILFGAVGSVQ